MLEIQSGAPEIYWRVRCPALLLAYYSSIELVEYGLHKVRLPSHSEWIADITAGPSRAITSHSTLLSEADLQWTPLPAPSQPPVQVLHWPEAVGQFWIHQHAEAAVI